jgi:enamine deaminase RidA (YjgF/YER057c/UK114 family)
METFRIPTPDGANVHVSSLAPAGGAKELHLTVAPQAAGTFVEQLRSLEAGYALALRELGLQDESAVFRRVFLSDAANQAAVVRASRLAAPPDGDPIAVSIVQQPPLPDCKIALWAHHVCDAAPLKKERIEGGVALRRGPRTHLWLAGLPSHAARESSSFEQTHVAFEACAQTLAAEGATLRDHLVRTWLFVRDIDAHYQGMVAARAELFKRHGLTRSSHYVASTGIEGRGAERHAFVALDAYAVAGLASEQVHFLNAPQHLGPTADYGVTFERGTAVDHGDRRHVFISGTASIDPTGATLHVGDCKRQLERALENIDALLADADAAPGDVAHILAYLRDPADRALVERELRGRHPTIPALILLAPVCRPGWLVEVECIASVAQRAPRWSTF